MFPITDPTWIFFIVLCVILFAPMLLAKFRLPSIVGLIVAGVCIGPYGFHVLDYDESFRLFGKVGIYYIMFLASLEMNVQDVRSVKWQTVTLGLLSFLFPFVFGLAANLGLGFSLIAGTLMASMYASHTLIAYPIVLRYGLSRRKSVSIATGSTIVADVLTLLVLAIIGGLFKEDAGEWVGLWLVLKIVAIGFFIIFFFPRIGQWFFRHFEDGVVQYIFVLSMVFLGAALMELIGIEGILGAFLVGIILNRLIPPASPLMNRIEFIGNSIFIPYFLIGVGMIINIQALLDVRHTLPLAIVMVVVASLGKWLATLVTQKSFRLSVADRNLMFGLTNARAAATLAIVLVGYGIVQADGSRLLGDEVLNATMLFILASCIISSFVTERTAVHIALKKEEVTVTDTVENKEQIMVALSNEEGSDCLIHAALMLRSHKKGTLLSAINVILENDAAHRQRAAAILERAAKTAAASNVKLTPYDRWSVNVVTGIYHAMLETSSSDLLIGLHQKEKLSDSFFGKITNDLLATLRQQIIIYRQSVPLNTVRKIHVLVPRRAELEQGFPLWMERIALLAIQIGCRINIYAHQQTANAMRKQWEVLQYSLRIEEWVDFSKWNDLAPVVHRTRQDHLLIFVLARTGTLSYHHYMEHLPDQVERYFSTRNLMIVFPEQYTGKQSSSDIRSGLPMELRIEV